MMKNPNQSIVLAGFSTKDMIIKRKEGAANLLFNDPHVSFLRLPFNAQTFIDSVISADSQEKEVDKSAKETAFLKSFEHRVSAFFHDVKYHKVPEINKVSSYSEKLKVLFSLHSKNEMVKTFEDEIISLISLQHPEYKHL